MGMASGTVQAIPWASHPCITTGRLICGEIGADCFAFDPRARGRALPPGRRRQAPMPARRAAPADLRAEQQRSDGHDCVFPVPCWSRARLPGHPGGPAHHLAAAAI